MTRIVLTGAGGLMGQAFAARLTGGHQLTTLPHAALDAGAPAQVEALLERTRPEVVINCAAYTDVEGAERDPQADENANVQLPRAIAAACRALDATLLHFSSTGCYGRRQAEPYLEDDALEPTTQHHRDKAAGEAAVRESGCHHLIVRTGWLYGGEPAQAKNFVWKRLVEARGKTEMTSDASQRGCPTWAGDVARQAVVLLDAGLEGTFNVVAAGAASRFEYVRHIVEAAGIRCRVLPGPAFQRLAAVSDNETARNARLQAMGLDQMPAWQPALTAYVQTLLASPQWHALFG